MAGKGDWHGTEELESEQVQIPEDPAEALRLAHELALNCQEAIRFIYWIDLFEGFDARTFLETRDVKELESFEVYAKQSFSKLLHLIERLEALLNLQPIYRILTLGAQPLFADDPILYGNFDHAHQRVLETANRVAVCIYITPRPCPTWCQELRISAQERFPEFAELQHDTEYSNSFPDRIAFMDGFMNDVKIGTERFVETEEFRPTEALLRREYRNALKELNEERNAAGLHAPKSDPIETIPKQKRGRKRLDVRMVEKYWKIRTRWDAGTDRGERWRSYKELADEMGTDETTVRKAVDWTAKHPDRRPRR